MKTQEVHIRMNGRHDVTLIPGVPCNPVAPVAPTPGRPCNPVGPVEPVEPTDPVGPGMAAKLEHNFSSQTRKRNAMSALLLS